MVQSTLHSKFTAKIWFLNFGGGGHLESTELFQKERNILYYQYYESNLDKKPQITYNAWENSAFPKGHPPHPLLPPTCCSISEKCLNSGKTPNALLIGNLRF